MTYVILKMMKSPLIFVCALFAGITASQAALVNINFETFTPSPGTPATESELEGPGGGLGTQWNQYQAASSSGTIVDSTGADTTLSVTTNFTEGRGGNSGNLDVFHSTLTDFGRKQNRTVTISGLEADGIYDIWIMAYRDNGAAAERLGGYWSTTNATSSPSGERLLSSYVTRNGSTFEEGVNYLLYENVVADGSGNIVFTGRGGAATDPDFPEDVRLGLSALQISAVPEPSSLALVGLGLLTFCARRMRRR